MISMGITNSKDAHMLKFLGMFPICSDTSYCCCCGSNVTIFFCSDVDREVKWLTPNDPAHKVLVEYLKSDGFLAQLRQTAYGTHTGSLENLHSLILAYCSKRIDFDPASYKGRVSLAILDHNENIGRPLKLG